MPPVKKYERKEIIEAALRIIEKDGASAVNARRIAKELDCSVQPIFHNFANMKELNDAVYMAMYEKYTEYMTANMDKEKPYKQMGLGYIKFAKEHPAFFKAIFMQPTRLDAKVFIMSDQLGEEVIRVGQELTGLSYDEQKKFHVKVWIFTHGIACLLATRTIYMSDEEVEATLEFTVREMLIGFKVEEGIE